MLHLWLTILTPFRRYGYNQAVYVAVYLAEAWIGLETSQLIGRWNTYCIVEEGANTGKRYYYGIDWGRARQ